MWRLGATERWHQYPRPFLQSSRRPHQASANWIHGMLLSLPQNSSTTSPHTGQGASSMSWVERIDMNASHRPQCHKVVRNCGGAEYWLPISGLSIIRLLSILPSLPWEIHAEHCQFSQSAIAQGAIPSGRKHRDLLRRQLPDYKSLRPIFSPLAYRLAPHKRFLPPNRQQALTEQRWRIGIQRQSILM